MSTKEQREIDHNWHVAINKTVDALDYKARFMYTAKDIAEESRRLPYWFAKERKGELAKSHRQCSRSEPEEIVDNHLTCCLGVECRKCEILLNLEAKSENIPPEAMDQIKAWTCIAHILAEDAGRRVIDTSEGMILTTDDRMFWDRVYESMSGRDPEDAEGA